MTRHQIIQRSETILIDIENLKIKLESNREKELLKADEKQKDEIQLLYKKTLNPIYRIRNNIAAILLSTGKAWKEEEDKIKILTDNNIELVFPKIPIIKSLKNYDQLLKENNELNKKKEEMKVPPILNPKIQITERETDAIYIDSENLEQDKNDNILFNESQFHNNKIPIKSDPSFTERPLEDNAHFEKGDSFTENPAFDEDMDSFLDMFFGEENSKNTIEDNEIEEPRQEEHATEFNTKHSKEESEYEDETHNELKELEKANLYEDSSVLQEETENNDLDSLFNSDNYEEEIVQTVTDEEESIIYEKGVNSKKDALCNKKTDQILQEYDMGIYRESPVKAVSKKEDILPDIRENVQSNAKNSDLELLKRKRKEYNQIKIIEEIKKNQVDEDDKIDFFDLSTGMETKGTLKVKNETDKIKRIADGIIQAEKKDKMQDMLFKTDDLNAVYTYQIQKESDFTRGKNEFIFDIYELDLEIAAEDEQIKQEKCILYIAPMDIPKSGEAIVTDICACLKTERGPIAGVVQPNGKSSLVLKTECYTLFSRGSWENGNFVTNFSIIGKGCQVNIKSKKKSIRPNHMEGIGIGHNVLYVDHATTIHVIPLSLNNPLFGYSEYMAIVHKDYGIDEDSECIVTNGKPDLMINGEKYRYKLIGQWEGSKFNLNLKIDR